MCGHIASPSHIILSTTGTVLQWLLFAWEVTYYSELIVVVSMQLMLLRHSLSKASISKHALNVDSDRPRCGSLFVCIRHTSV